MKFPTDLLDYGYKWSDFLEGDTIASATVTATPRGLTIGEAGYYQDIVKVMISGGVRGTTYKVKCKITTVAGSVANSEFTLLVTEDAR